MGEADMGIGWGGKGMAGMGKADMVIGGGVAYMVIGEGGMDKADMVIMMPIELGEADLVMGGDGMGKVKMVIGGSSMGEADEAIMMPIEVGVLNFLKFLFSHWEIFFKSFFTRYNSDNFDF